MLFSCKSQKKEAIEQNTTVNSKMDIPKKHTSKKLDSLSLNNIRLWKEYFDLKDFLKVYEEISSREALNNALELKQLTKLAKDSIDIEELKAPAFKARINVFQNEVLRLADMTYIPAITAKEIDLQVKNVFSTFSSLNSKIEHTFRKKSFDNSVKIDSIFNKIR
ncbi:hypothetical protein SAMN04489761_4623 [Tenacibaculum sp. MAR_2009_124]|nr:hypothetical protein SAMN04489761_4623 [Tenacibaculum sp. MAR_2009_124]